MHRFFAPPELTQDAEFNLPAPEAHHAAKVLRIQAGDHAVVLNGQGEEILGELTEVNRQRAHFRVLQRHLSPPLPCRITLFQAIPKSRAMDFIVQKATELGATRIVPLVSERTVAQWDEDTAAHRTVKWRTIAVESAKQCGTPWLPQIENPTSVDTAFERHDPADLHLLASLQPDAQQPRSIFAAHRSESSSCLKSVSVWVGPEGDYTPAEINTIRSRTAAFPITLGPLVLRSETAALYCLAIISYEAQSP